MIKPEKLKELIEKESTIYSVQNNKIFEVELKIGGRKYDSLGD